MRERETVYHVMVDLKDAGILKTFPDAFKFFLRRITQTDDSGFGNIDDKNFIVKDKNGIKMALSFNECRQLAWDLGLLTRDNITRIAPQKPDCKKIAKKRFSKSDPIALRKWEAATKTDHDSQFTIIVISEEDIPSSKKSVDRLMRKIRNILLHKII